MNDLADSAARSNIIVNYGNIHQYGFPVLYRHAWVSMTSLFFIRIFPKYFSAISVRKNCGPKIVSNSVLSLNRLPKRSQEKYFLILTGK